MSDLRVLLFVASMACAPTLGAQSSWPEPYPMPAVPAVPRAASAPSAPSAPYAPAVWATTPSVAYASSGGLFGPAPQRFPQDPADSLYRAARNRLNEGDWRRAAETFAAVARHQPPSAYAADALYWQAFALYRIGGTAELRSAVSVLDARQSRYPNARSESEAATLAVRIRGALAARGDANAQAAVARAAATSDASCDSEELSVRSSALSALQRTDPEAAQQLLGRILERKDECSVPLRKTAVTMLGTRNDATARARLASVVRSDPSIDVRVSAVGHLGRSEGEEGVAAMEQLLRNDSEPEQVRRAAVRALGALEGARAKGAIRALVERSSAPEALRLEALGTFERSGATALVAGSAAPFMRYDAGGVAVAGVAAVAPTPPTPPTSPVPAASPSGARMVTIDRPYDTQVVSVNGTTWTLPSSASRLTAEDAAWLRGVYPRLETARLKSRAISVLARARDEATLTWMMALVQRDEESPSIRATALSRLGRDLPIVQLNRLYDQASNRTVRQQIVSTLGARSEPEATDKLLEIVRNDTDPQLRRSALGALNRKNDPRTIKLMMELIDR